MIISHKYKFLFIGLPFSASSAISKELYKKYNGKPLLRKHSLYHEFEKIATPEEKEYFVFAVLRNPLEIAITVYEKMKSNTKGNFNNPKLFKENGGHITQDQREKFNYIKKNNASFQEYFLKYHKIPFDNFSRITLDHCNYIIRYENIERHYDEALSKIGIKNKKPLPVANKTDGKNKDINQYYTKEIQKRASYVFGPFLERYGYNIPTEWQYRHVPYSSYLLFNIFGWIRKYKWKSRKYSTRKSIRGSIYGDMQREQ